MAGKSAVIAIPTVMVLAFSPSAWAQPAVAPVLTVDPAEVKSVQAPGERVDHALTISNTGDAELHWRVLEGADEPRRLPPGATAPVAAVPAPDPSGRAALERFPGFAGRPGWTVDPELPTPPEGTLSITHSGSPAIVAGSSVACARSRGVRTAATSYLRHFTLADFGITGDLEVTSVTFGVESLRGRSPALTVNLYTLAEAGGQFAYDNLNLIGSAEHTLDRQSMTMVEVPVTGTVPAGSTLVVELAAPEMTSGGFYIGAHPGEQTAPSYLAAEACGIPEPALTTELGFPELQILLDVTGFAETPACDAPKSWVDVDPVAGAVVPGGEEVVEVTLDAAGRPDGDRLEASLCLVSNDPAAPWVEVPVRMTVDDPCDRRIAGVHSGPLTVTEGVTCLEPGSRVQGTVNVLDGAGLTANSATIQGPVAAFGATTVELRETQVTGPVAVYGTTGSLTLAGNQVVGSIALIGNQTGAEPIVVAGNWVIGSLFFTRNQPAPGHDGVPNTLVGGSALDQCAGL